MNALSKISGNILDVNNRKIIHGEIFIEDGKIKEIVEKDINTEIFITPGLVDAHIHIESSMLTPGNFAEAVIPHGTIALVADPHEIANVLGVEGVKYLIENAALTPIKFCFGAPSCVPATHFENTGAEITEKDIERLFREESVSYLAEVMNYPGVISNDATVLKKIFIAGKYKKKIDGHAPGLSGKNLLKYVEKGILTDHECTNINEAVEKVNAGMKIFIREGSAAKNFNALFPLIDKYPDQIMFCSDDLHPDDLIKGHINLLVKKAIDRGANLYNVFKACTLNPVTHYGLNTGLLKAGDPADFIVFDNKKNLKVIKTISKGNVIYNNGSLKWKATKPRRINFFNADKILMKDLSIPEKGKPVKIIKIRDGDIITEKIIGKPNTFKNKLVSDISQDFLKIAVINRFFKEKPALAFIHGFGLKRGAIAGSVAHDSHNIIAVGTNDKYLKQIINWIIHKNGGLAIHDGKQIYGLPLPVAGIISDSKIRAVSSKYAMLNEKAAFLGSTLKAPFMTLSFMALLVIPELKLSNKGLFDVNSFALTDLYEE